MYYGARFYDPALSFFVSADTMAADTANPKTRNRYSYVNLVDTKASKDPASSALLFTSSSRGTNSTTIQMWLSVQATVGEKGEIHVDMRTATKQFKWDDF